MRAYLIAAAIFSTLLPYFLSAEKVVEWKLSKIANVNPVDTVSFNGIDRVFVLNENPLDSLETYTIEVIFRPDSDGPTEQRFLHFGDMKHRIMFETRINTLKEWYLDIHYNSGREDKQNTVTLIDSTLTHPTDRWYTITATFDHDKITTYVDGTKELEQSVTIAPFREGKTTIGARQNLVGWFKGAIYNIRVSEGVLPVDQFLTLESIKCN